MHRRRTSLLASVSVCLALALAGCGEDGGPACDDRVELAPDFLVEGDYALSGAADGQLFDCALALDIANVGENPEDYQLSGACTGAARLHAGLVVIEGTPATIAWTLVWTDPENPSRQEYRTGRLEPVYEGEGGCRVATSAVP